MGSRCCGTLQYFHLHTGSVPTSRAASYLTSELETDPQDHLLRYLVNESEAKLLSAEAQIMADLLLHLPTVRLVLLL